MVGGAKLAPMSNSRRTRFKWVVFAFLAVSVVGATFGAARNAMSAGSPASQRCFGAAARDPEVPCHNSRLLLVVDPNPSKAFKSPNWPCKLLDPGALIEACAFGVPQSQAAGTVVLIGDSHAAHWRAAVDYLAGVKHWYGLSLMRPGCPLSTAVERLRAELRRECIAWNRRLPGWFRKHPSVSTVFTVAESGAKWEVPHGKSASSAEVSGFIRAWRRLPRAVKRFVVIRDSPKDPDSTVACIEHAIARSKPAGRDCAVRRSRALYRDPAVEAVARMHSKRFQEINLTHFFCDPHRCYPVVGGALVHKDTHHLTTTFVRTLGPYLVRSFDQLPIPAGAPG